MSEKVVKNFVQNYAREFDFFQVASRICAERCEVLLAERGIRAIVSHRAKRPQKLAAKLRQRDVEKKYRSADQVRRDIADLAGVRIALYFPGDRGRVAEIIRDNFEVEQEKHFPVAAKRRAQKRFEGYYADHFRLRLSDDTLDDAQKSYAQAMIEVQVGSVLMHAWAEVEHDLVYKPESGELSEDEHAILDELNGMVIAGEIALERLQRAVERRLASSQGRSFDNHYDLASFLDKWAGAHVKAGNTLRVGRVDILWVLLKAAGANSVERVGELLAAIDLDRPEIRIADVLSDALLADHPELYEQYVSLQSDMAIATSQLLSSPSRDHSRAIGEFLSAWIVIERTFAALSGDDRKPYPQSSIYATARKFGLSEEAEHNLQRARHVRNQLVHGVEFPGTAYLDRLTNELKGTVLSELENSPHQDVRDAFVAARDRLPKD